jgi:Cu(I)/Ag(I) efflux system membrane protein CusA/SilA
VKVKPAYDRSGLIYRAIENLKEKIIEKMIVVALICMLFLLHARSALVAIFTLPAGVLISFIIMTSLGINANIMSLGGIAIGVMVDASVVMVENAHKHMERDKGKKDTGR